MVFEKLVADILNRFIGEYVENLDSSQLKIGIWGGDVVLRNLKLKETCLDSLDLPVRTIYGHLGKLVLKIPWKNLYGGSVEASIDSLYLLVVPTQDVTYDMEKEEKNKQTAKQNEISRIENIKFLDQEKSKLDQDKVKDSFVEKLATQIIRNVQINIKSIHIRYEDRITFPNHPFSFGCTLYDLTSHSTDSNWNRFIDKGQDPLAMIFKIISMEGYAVYWNSKGSLFTEHSKETYKDMFENGIPKKDVLPDGYEYLLGPINAKAKMKMNPKPELDGSDFTIPKYDISIDMESLNIRISKTQYKNLIMAAESIDRLTKAMPYRKYRPMLKEYKGNYKEWWKFAYKCVLEEDVRRIHRNWDWFHIQSHRKLIQEYRILYKQKLESKKLSAITLNRISELENSLDVMNIILTRQRVENEVEREGKIQEEIRKVESERGWFSFWRTKDSDTEEKEKNIIKQFEEAMNASEKEKLYKAIGYQESSVATIYPETFIDTNFKFCLHTLEISVFDEEFTSIHKVLTVNFKGFVLNLQTRIAANAMKVEASGETLSVFGLPQSNKIPKLITSKAFDQYRSAQDLAFSQDNDEDGTERQMMYLFNLLFETNPLDQLCDSRVQLSFRPLKMVYDAQTIIKIMNIFTTQQSNVATQLQAAAGTKLAEIKEKSALGMQHIIEEHKRLELKIDMMASYIVIPHGGFYRKNQSLLLFNLGCLKIKSKPQNLEDVSIQSMHKKGATQSEVLQGIVSRSYDRYYIELENAQILIANKGENWKNKFNESFQNELYILKPTTLTIQVEKCLITDDPRLPLLKVTGELPAIDIKMAENRFLDALSVFLSVPLPKKAKELDDNLHDFDILGSAMSLRQKIDSFNMTKNLTNQRKEAEKASDVNVQFTSLDVKLVLKRLSVKVLSYDGKGSWLNPLLDFNLLTLELSLTQQTFNTNIALKLGRLFLAQYHKDTIIPLVDTPNEDENQYLLLMKYTLVDKNSPEFHTNDHVLQLLELNFTKILATANREALLYLIDWMNNVSSNISNMQKQYNYNTEEIPVTLQVQKTNKLKRMHLVSNALSTILEESATTKVQQLNKRTTEDNDMKDLKLIAQIGEIQLIIVTENEDLAHMFITQLESCITMKKSDIQIDAKLQNISVFDPSSDTIYKYIIHVAENDDALKLQMIMYNEQYLVDYDSPEIYMSISSGCIKCVFLNRFVTKLLNFINHFQAGKAAVYEAGAAAVATAKMNVKSATRVALDINLKAPVFIVPQNSFSLEALCFDFGYLSITNSFMVIHKGADHIPAIIDKLSLNLQDLKVSRVKLNDGVKFFVFDCLLLQPITFSLIVKRNLSSAWYTDHPDFDIVAMFDSIKVTVSHVDYTVVMKVLNENLSEGKDELAIPNEELNITKLNKSNETKVVVDIENKYQSEEIRTLAKFEFSVKNIILELFKEGPGENGFQIKDNSMGQFMFSSLTVDGSMYTDLSLALTLYLLDVILDDTRVNSTNKVVRYMERKKNNIENDNLQNTIDIKYKQTPTGSDVQLKIFSFNLIFNVEYIQYLLNFFILPSQNQDIGLNDAAKNPKLTVMKEQSNAIEPKENNKTLLLKLQLEKPDIILVESLDDINTNAIIMNTEATLKLRMSTPTRQTVNGEIKDLQIYSCCYNPLRRKDTMNLILCPVTINVIGSTPDDTCLHVDVTMTPVIISVTPANIEMLNRINQSLTEKKENISCEPKYDEQSFYDLWNKTQFNDSEFWFLKTESATEACTSDTNNIQSVLKKSEVCLISIPSIVFTIEAGIGTKTMPMLLTECTFNGSVNNWSSKLSVAGELTMQMNYYNSRLALWEPFIEPVEIESSIGPKYVPWLLELKLETFDPNESSQDEVFQRKPTMKISLISYQTIEITMTKTALEVMTSLGKAFNEAITAEIPLSKRIEAAPYVVQNNLGFDIAIMISNTPFKLCAINEEEILSDVILKDREQINLCLKEDDSVSVHLRQTTNIERSLKIKIQENNNTTIFSLPLIKADKRYFNIKHKLRTVLEPWGLVTDAQVINGSMVVTLRSVVQIHNHFNENIFLYYKKDGKLKMIGKAKPDKPFNLPVHSIYTQTKEILFCPEKYQICIKPFIWKDIQPMMNLRALLQCPPNQVEDKDPFFIQVLGNMEHIYFEHTDRYLMSSNCYNIHLYPTVILVNALPVNLDCLMQGDSDIKTLAPGEKINLPIIEIGYSCLTLQIKYLDKFWDCKCTIEEHPDEFSIWSFTNNEDKPDTNANVINFGIRTEFHNGGTHIKTLYCPIWMINKTGRILTYKALDDEANMLKHSSNPTEPLMWSFKKKIFFANKKAYVKIDSGLWSDRFSLDVAGNSGSIMCKTNDILYQIGVHIQLTNNSLTKQVTLTPFYIASNQCPFSIDVQEADKVQQPWIKVEPNSCMPFWPQNITDKHTLSDKVFVVRIAGTSDASTPLPYFKSRSDLIRLRNKYSALQVDTQMTEGGTYITFSPYMEGMAPALIINHTENYLKFIEHDLSEYLDEIKILPPRHKMFFSWSTPTDHPIIYWNMMQNQADLRKDGVGVFNQDDGIKVYWVSFLDGMQRILMFTVDANIAEECQASSKLEIINREILISIHSLGLSLVNNDLCMELMYLRIGSSGVIWETKKLSGSRYKPMTPRECELVEAAFIRYTRKLAIGENEPNVLIKELNIEINFAENIVTKPKRNIRRIYNTGFWLNLQSSDYTSQIHAKINNLQIDSQIDNSIFPVVFAPVPPPKTIAQTERKPFVELSIVERLNKYSTVKQYKYYKMLIQEFHIKLDINFINAIIKMTEKYELSEEERLKMFNEDLLYASNPLQSQITTHSLQEQKNYYDMLHFSPLKIHVTFSLSGDELENIPPIINIILQSIGVTVTSVQDVVLKLAFFERQYVVLNQRQLMIEAQHHYVSQLIKQLYVLVLGLDVLGNPFGLVSGFKQGVEDLFYEPFQGAIQGPEEFAEGLVLGVKSLFGHTVGGAAGAVGRITGAMGKGIAALTFDKDYQKKRQELMNQQPTNIPAGLAQGGRGLVLGVVEGVEGVFEKPISGARNDGVEGFFKGVCQGMVGLVARPLSGALDFTSGTLNTIKRVTDTTSEVQRVRLPRYFKEDKQVRPYCKREAEGYKLIKVKKTNVFNYI
ncbi:Hypothetical protein CINCED_3A023147 [Cinara cedri]|uniref:Uncharacterized protein n=1 Tax=Cinara cedri TaxID=506608 RepID=A0A5E4N979_9HEMI|nr:Hypothetical protein CINCED_3A023147 [Cinara cedri]